ncbi:MAG: hypothetical protein KJO80_02580 [Gammaproteobacteria bacterium]|nr:hypothetical protein [Gammaproteobacteria bacterium]
MTARKKRMACALLVLALVGTMGVSHAQEHNEAGDDHEASSDALHLGTYRTWLFRSFMPDSNNDATTLGLEFVSSWGWGDYNATNISYIEIADYEVGIPGLPPGNPEPTPVGGTGINDLLTAFLFSKKGGHHGPHHFGWGFSAQIPTGASDTLSSGKWSLGPAVEYEYIGDRLFVAVVALQLWSVAGDSDRKDVSMMMIKPMVTYDLNEKWKAVYMPYGISAYWNKPSGQKWYVPLGGGIQRQFNIGSRASAFSAQLFRNVVRPDKGAEHDFRLLLEINF